MKNDPDLAAKYGNDRDLFARNKAEAAISKGEYHVSTVDTAFPCEKDHTMEIEIRIASGFDLRTDVLLMKQLSVSRSRIKKWSENEVILSGCQLISPNGKVKDGMILQIKTEVFRSEPEMERSFLSQPDPSANGKIRNGDFTV